MSDEVDDVPLIAPEGSTPYGSPVIDLAEVRIRFGRPDDALQRKACKHQNVIYSTKERRVWCEDCTRTLDTFDAYMIVVRNFHAMVADAQHKQRRAAEAEAATLVKRATKIIDKAWNGHQMAVCCPHCHAGLLPEDFEHGCSQVSGEIERARRARLKP